LEDAVEAMNSLFEVLSTLVRCMSPVTPFLVEHLRKRANLEPTDMIHMYYYEFTQHLSNVLEQAIQG
jgi:isoleucyl-tRNA synthetase